MGDSEHREHGSSRRHGSPQGQVRARSGPARAKLGFFNRGCGSHQKVHQVSHKFSLAKLKGDPEALRRDHLPTPLKDRIAQVG